jgi:hypothetical protein
MYLWDKDKSSWPAELFWKLLKWVKLSNSGDLLELLIPNYIWKAISGWTNHSCKVTSQKAYENNVEYRGSKSYSKLKYVKEQRVDDSWCIKFKHLRCILMDFERNYRVKFLSKQINVGIRSFSTLPPASKMDPWFLTGFCDAESSFSTLIQFNSKFKSLWRVKLIFAIGYIKKIFQS